MSDDRGTLQRQLAAYGEALRSGGDRDAVPEWLSALSDKEIGWLLDACGAEGERRGAAEYWWETGDLVTALPNYRPS